MEEVRIYIAEQRGEMVIDEGKLSSTLNYGEYASPHRKPIGRLHHVNEWRGCSGQVLTLPLVELSVSIFIPLEEGLVLRIKEQEYIVPLGSLLILPTDVEADVLTRQFGAGDGYFTFQQFVFSTTESHAQEIRSYVLPIVNPLDKNRMIPVLDNEDTPFQIYVGAFVGKVDYKLALDAGFDYVFALALDGNFEVEDRLLFQGDALSLPGFHKLEMECLSDTGLLLAIYY
ncbi:hypothetical protein FAZ19_11720 [Sphingobacterium alkalisoli]|uniref:Quercetin 2,3-dioxygenase C-terminal cupin domain-containing protein n=1 Tax=Sphingobacterium alkalisoli TaxID=1874115 RepID=A0A4U0H2G0_9SPHI|nr:hypothetical protein [Sphingobacterium alkalisoli]TJY65780.1 hypothetical protein FAZ19_11720 [Sphingobacterium alkalisoli]GGH18366.1 hypothetical protein GCM10011418_21940 [Sphingobacterium alkalisoli]